MAAQNGHSEIVRLLTDKGASVETGHGQYSTNALTQAALEGHEEIVTFLLDQEQT